MWVVLALVAALGGALTSLVLKHAVGHAGAVVSTVAFRLVAAVALTGIMVATSGWPEPTPAYWRVAALVILPEVAGILCLSLALRAGELSVVHPLLGLLPLFVVLGGAAFLDEIPTRAAAGGILLVTAGVYCVGLRTRGSLLEPFRALVRSKASWYAVGAAFFWSITTMLHKIGIAEIGPLPWAVTLTLGSGVALALALPFLQWQRRTIGLPERTGPWAALVVGAGLIFAVQLASLNLSLRLAQAGYVVALSSTSTLLATALGVLFLGERSAARNRIAGGLLVSGGAVLIALFG